MTWRALIASTARHARRSKLLMRLEALPIGGQQKVCSESWQEGVRHLSAAGNGGFPSTKGSGSQALARDTWTASGWHAGSGTPAVLQMTAGMATDSYQDERAYAQDVMEYNQVLLQLTKRKRAYMLRDAYDDMLMDGITPNRDTFHIAIPGCMKSQRLQDAFYFFNQMKSLGIQPDVVLYNCLISTCGRCYQVDRAFQVAEEMEGMGIAPKLRTFVALLNACGIAGRVNEAWGVVQRMTVYGLTMNKYCYSALITAYKNRRPILKETTDKIFELLEESKDKRADDDVALAQTLGEDGDELEVEEEQGLLWEGRRGAAQRELVVYHSAMRAMVELDNYEGALKVAQNIEKMGIAMDGFTLMQLVRAHLNAGKLGSAMDAFDSFLGHGHSPSLELYIGLIEAAILKYSADGMAMAKRLLMELKERGFFLNSRYGGHLLALASRERYGDFSVASIVFEMMQEQPGQRPPFQPSLAFLRGLLSRQTPEDDPRLVAVRAIVNERLSDRRSYFKKEEKDSAEKGAPSQQAQSTAEEDLGKDASEPEPESAAVQAHASP